MLKICTWQICVIFLKGNGVRKLLSVARFQGWRKKWSNTNIRNGMKSADWFEPVCFLSEELFFNLIVIESVISVTQVWPDSFAREAMLHVPVSFSLLFQFAFVRYSFFFFFFAIESNVIGKTCPAASYNRSEDQQKKNSNTSNKISDFIESVLKILTSSLLTMRIKKHIDY